MPGGLRSGRRRTVAWSMPAAAATLTAAAVLALLGGPAAVGAGPLEAANLITSDWPRWVHNLADLLQIVTPVVAGAAWVGARRVRRR